MADDGYLHFVASLLQDSDHDDALVTKYELPTFSLEAEVTSSDDFLPSSKDFLVRDRAFSWDITLEEQVHANLIAAQDHSKGQKSFIKRETGGPVKKGRKYDGINIKSENRQKRPTIKKEVKKEQNASNKRTADGEIKSISSNISPPPTTVVTTVLSASDSLPSVIAPICMQTVPKVEHPVSPLDSEVLIGAYTKEQRKERIDRFRAKKQRRIWRKQIKYDCRKRLADTRPRIKGRFVSRKGSPIDDGTEADVDADSTSLMEPQDVDHIDDGDGDELEEVSRLLM
mmetsp:Transcript_28400/g.28704  ORF Transcript_28400/g.28704 Transcript_28400/m.28704 type:complete len:285 (+) Transcript_28400:167-1021(+)|eukprot:CAMPEP_0182427456 /NCGR_PEP_ID=MMETSP1167-20130531/17188_1 /TAXON_ID=2988 /ORGANISM="Mallomonas Sp, Strain CCMP3275" /LENGTH=284 /DNA_ID=CAMNT_0024609697 /DNA_START=148 /DNA_END=1002 /DNA_ORIENTATION=-